MVSANQCISMFVEALLFRIDLLTYYSASNCLPSADYPFGAKSQYGPTVTSIRHPELYEGRPATIDPMPVPLQRAAVSVP